MLTKHIATIEEHQKLAGGRFTLAQIVMRRTRQLMNKAPIIDIDVKKVGSDFNHKKHEEIAPHLFPKIALEELRNGKLNWKRIEKAKTVVNDDNQIVFSE